MKLRLLLPLLLTALMACQPPPPSPQPSPLHPLPAPGHASWSGRTTHEAVAAFDTWAATPSTYLSSFVPPAKGFPGFAQWDPIAAEWARTDRTLILSVPLVPAGETFASVASGSGTDALTHLARTLIDNRLARRTIVRIGWESGGPWFRWAARPDPEGYRQAYRRVTSTLRQTIPGLRTEFNLDCDHYPTTPAWYPGDDVVDVIGVDCYSRAPWDPETWNQRPDGWRWILNQVRGLAKSHGKALAVSEWGVGLDRSSLVTDFLSWARRANVLYHVYFQGRGTFPNGQSWDTYLTDNHQPNTAQAYREGIR